MGSDLPGSVLFCCDHNAIRSPIAEGMMKRLFGQQAYVQSAGVHNDLEIDGFAIAVCEEQGIELSRHQSRSFIEMRQLGEDLTGFDLIVALSPASYQRALELAGNSHLPVEFWDVSDPTGSGGKREEKLAAYRKTRDEIRDHMIKRFGPSDVS